MITILSSISYKLLVANFWIILCYICVFVMNKYGHVVTIPVERIWAAISWVDWDGKGIFPQCFLSQFSWVHPLESGVQQEKKCWPSFPNTYLVAICVILSPLPHLSVLVLGWSIVLWVCRGIGAWFLSSAETTIKKVIPVFPHKNQEWLFEGLLFISHLLQSNLQITCQK